MEYFYRPEMVQRTFAVLSGLFYWVGLRTNTRNTVSMECQSYHAPGRMSSEVYKRRTKGTGTTFQEQHRRSLDFPEFNVEVMSGLLQTHRQIQHGVGRGDQGGVPPRGGPNLPGLFPKFSVVDPVPSGGYPRRVLESDQPPGLLCAPPHAGHNSYPGGREPNVSQVPPVSHVFSHKALNARHLKTAFYRWG